MSNEFDSVIDSYLDISGIKKYLEEDGVTDIAVNEPGYIWVERDNGWTREHSSGASYDVLHTLASSLCNYNQLVLDESHPIHSVELPSGERGQVVIPPVSMSGHVIISIRKPSLKRFTLDDYISSGRFNDVKTASKNISVLSEMQEKLQSIYQIGTSDSIGEFLKEAVKARLNFLIVGGTGSGKTTVAKAIADLFPIDRRYITIEDVHEMSLPNHPNKVHLFYKKGVVEPKEVIEACMRLKPDHIFLAELRGHESWSYLDALNSGHEGSISTIHANNTYAAFSRLASIIKQSDVGMTIDMDLIMKTIKTSIDVILFFNNKRLTEIYYDPDEKNKLLNEM